MSVSAPYHVLQKCHYLWVIKVLLLIPFWLSSSSERQQEEKILTTSTLKRFCPPLSNLQCS